MSLSIGSNIISSSFPMKSIPIEDITNAITDAVFTNVSTMIEINKMNLLQDLYPINSLYISVNDTLPSQLQALGTWELDSKIINTNGWQNYIWSNSDYIGTTQSCYTLNQWCVKDNVIYIVCGFGATATMNSATEYELARMPIKNTYPVNNDKRIWNGAVGGSGSYNGFIIKQNTDYLSIYIKPHTTANGHSAPWASSFFSIPLNDGFITNPSIFTSKYIFKRIS